MHISRPTSIPLTCKVEGSSNIAELAHAGDTLYIKFLGSGWYSYVGAGLTQYDELRLAESVGKHFHAVIKKSFTGVKLPPEEAANLGLSS